MYYSKVNIFKFKKTTMAFYTIYVEYILNYYAEAHDFLFIYCLMLSEKAIITVGIIIIVKDPTGINYLENIIYSHWYVFT